MEKAGGILKNDNMAQKGSDKRSQAGAGGDDYSGGNNNNNNNY